MLGVTPPWIITFAHCVLPGLPPDPLLNGFDVVPGHATTIGVSATEMVKKGAPYSDCAQTSMETQRIINSIKIHIKD